MSTEMVRLEQIAALLEFLESEPDIAHDDCINTCEGRTAIFWVKCAKTLNMISPNCPQKSPSEWRKFYNEYKCKVLTKVKLRQREMEAFGGDSNRVTKLTPLQIRLYNLLEWDGQCQWLMSPTTHDRISEMDEYDFVIIEPPCKSETELSQTVSQEQLAELALQLPDYQQVIHKPANHMLVSPHQSNHQLPKQKSISRQPASQKSVSRKPANKKSAVNHQSPSYEPISPPEPSHQSHSQKPVGYKPIILKQVSKMPAEFQLSHQSASQQQVSQEPVRSQQANQPANHQSDVYQPASDHPPVPRTPAEMPNITLKDLLSQPQQIYGLQLSNNELKSQSTANLRSVRSKSLRVVITEVSDATMKGQLLVKSPKQLPNLEPLNHKAPHQPPTLQPPISPQLSDHQASNHAPLNHQSLNKQTAGHQTFHQSSIHQSFTYQSPTHQALSDQTSTYQSSIYQLPTHQTLTLQTSIHQTPTHHLLSSAVQPANPPQPIPQQPPSHQTLGHQPSCHPSSNHQNAGYPLRSQMQNEPPNLRSPKKLGRPKEGDTKVPEEAQVNSAKKQRKVEAQFENARATNNLAAAINKLGTSLDTASTRLAGAMEKMADLFKLLSEPEPTPS